MIYRLLAERLCGCGGTVVGNCLFFIGKGGLSICDGEIWGYIWICKCTYVHGYFVFVTVTENMRLWEYGSEELLVFYRETFFE